VEVSVEPERILIPGGEAIGVALQTQGVLVVGTSDLGGEGGDSPARLAGIRPGDVLVKLGGQQIESASHLSQLVAQGGGQPIQLQLLRDNRPMEVSLIPKRDQASGGYRLGIWVRDSTAGVGTLSFYDPKSAVYGALGHAITDADTGQPLSVRSGQVMHADVVDVQKGKKGTPGELKGSFLRENNKLGSILKNTTFGIYGKMDKTPENKLYPNGLPIGLMGTVRIGPATILSSVDGDGVKEFKVEIVQANRQTSPAPKSMVIKVTDPELLAKTGGIVQGMSGSPIIQNGHIIGAVTHVYVNDPTQGYGLYIEWMLRQEDGL
jgi:stage IV sporulation protein B